MDGPKDDAHAALANALKELALSKRIAGEIFDVVARAGHGQDDSARGGKSECGTRGGGLNRFKDGRFAAVRTGNGLGSDAISQIEDDGLGYLWMSSRAGILRVSKAELNACADGIQKQVKCLVYGLADGLPTKQAAKLAASITGASKNALYDLALELKAGD